MIKLAVIIKPCPWCKKTGSFLMNPDSETWLPVIKCNNTKCIMRPELRPEGKQLAIRKTGKKSLETVIKKINLCISYWNIGNPIEAIEKTVIYLDSRVIQQELQGHEKYLYDMELKDLTVNPLTIGCGND